MCNSCTGTERWVYVSLRLQCWHRYCVRKSAQSDTIAIAISIFPPTVDKPKMPELIALKVKSKYINIAQQIGANWREVGISLLDDEHGTVVEAIAKQFNNNAKDISTEILQRWVQGQGIDDTTWRGLLRVLKVHCRTLANSIEEALMEEEATHSEPGK